jgi:hypothetical protein
MNSKEATVNLVNGRGSKAQNVKVGVSVKLCRTFRKAHFKWSKKGRRLRLQTASRGDKESTAMELFVECMIACVISLEYFRRMCPSKFDCEFTLIEGHNLSKNWAIGFNLATFRALAAATGFWPDDFNDNIVASGWSVSPLNGSLLKNTKKERRQKRN